MIGLLLVAVGAGLLAGYLVRSQFAKQERDGWHSMLTETRRRLRASREQLKAAEQQHAYELDVANSLSDELGQDAWMLDALSAAYAAVIEGEKTVSVTVEVADADGSSTFIGVDQGNPPVRALMIQWATCNQWMNVRVPDSPEGLSG